MSQAQKLIRKAAREKVDANDDEADPDQKKFLMKKTKGVGEGGGAGKARDVVKSQAL